MAGVLAALALACVAFLAFFPCLRNGFVNWDDDAYILENPDVVHFTLSAAAKTFSSFYLGNYHPLTVISYGLEYRLFGPDPFVFHLTNLFLHICGGVLVLRLLRYFIDNRYVCWLAACVFLLHPLRVESVAWVSERKDVLCAVFFLASLLAYLRYVASGRAYRWLLLSLGLFSAALFSKAMAVSLPLVMLLADFALGRRGFGRLLREKLSFFLLAAAFSPVALLAQQHGGALRSITFIEGAREIPGSILFYLYKSVLPLQLSCLYPHVRFIGAPWLVPVLIKSGVLAALAALVWWSVRFSRLVVFGGLFFLITLLPVLQIVPLGSAAVADRYSYIPSVGLSILVAAGCAWLLQSSMRRCVRFCVRRVCAVLLTVCAAIWLFWLGALTWQRCAVWNNSILLWSDAVSKTRYNALGYYNLGRALEDRAAFDRAAAAYIQALRFKPDYEQALTNLCHCHVVRGRFSDALPLCREAIRIDPRGFRQQYLLGRVYEGLGQPEQAIAAYRQALVCNPDDLAAANDLAAAAGGRRDQRSDHGM